MEQQEQVERESLKEEMNTTVAEARMVIPGAQALFGFQTMAVFNNRFSDLPTSGRMCYLAGLGLLALSIALLLAPAAYHRIAQGGLVTRHLLRQSSLFISLGMVPLMLSLALDIYVVCLAALDDARVGAVAAALALAVFAGLWFIFPLARRQR
jgi:Family of unknown function (DUF6328)